MVWDLTAGVDEDHVLAWEIFLDDESVQHVRQVSVLYEEVIKWGMASSGKLGEGGRRYVEEGEVLDGEDGGFWGGEEELWGDLEEGGKDIEAVVEA
nr:hypothetical protein Iba_chr09cCG12790 [Ipomoea batatas]